MAGGTSGHAQKKNEFEALKSGCWSARRGMDNPLIRKLIIENSEERSGIADISAIRSGLIDRSGAVRAAAISVGIHSNAVSSEDIARALEDSEVEVRIAAIGPAIRYALATREQVEAALSDGSSIGSLDLKVATKVALFGFYMERIGGWQDTGLDKLADLLFTSNDFEKAGKALAALVDFYSDHAPHADTGTAMRG